MPGIKALRKIQLGVEPTAGTAVPATTIWRGTGGLEDQQEVKFPEEYTGYMGGLDRSYIAMLKAALTLEADATFEQLPYLLAAGVKNVVTGAADGSGSGKIYAYPLATTAPNVIKTYTIEGGDNQQAEQVAYAFVESLKLSGKSGEALTMSADWVGRQVEPVTYTAALTPPAVETILFGRGKLYIDDTSGTLGATLKSSTLMAMELSIKTGWVPVWTADGSLAYAFIKQTAPEVTLSVTFEHDATSVAEKAAWRAQTARQMRLLFEGSSTATAGTAYSKKTLAIDLAGKWQKFEKLDEIDGNDVVKGTLTARYNTTAALYAAVTVVNELVSLP